MLKKKTSKKCAFSLDDMPEIKVVKNQESLQIHDPESSFKNLEQVGGALLECLIDNDPEAFMEILDAYLRVNRPKTTKVSRSTTLPQKGAPTLKTIARIVHNSLAKKKRKAKSLL